MTQSPPNWASNQDAFDTFTKKTDTKGLKKITETTNSSKVAERLMLLTPVDPGGGYVFGSCAAKSFGRTAKVGTIRLRVHRARTHTCSSVRSNVVLALDCSKLARMSLEHRIVMPSPCRMMRSFPTRTASVGHWNIRAMLSSASPTSICVG